jgi:hypothetical protein
MTNQTIFSLLPHSLRWRHVLILLTMAVSGVQAQTVIGGSTPDNTAVLDVQSSNKGVLLPRLTNAQRDAIVSPANGLTIYNVSTKCINFYTGTAWFEVCGETTAAELNTIDGTSAVRTGALLVGTSASGVSFEVAYTGGNGKPYPAQEIASTGVTGLTANLSAGILSDGSGTLTFTITGTPSAGGTASFVINIGGQTTTVTFTVTSPPMFASGTIHCIFPPMVINDVLNPTTGRTWMDRNLGAKQVATSATDANSYGDWYQWGRLADGHQCRTSSTSTTLSAGNVPGTPSFITESAKWQVVTNENLWQGVDGINNPCPSGYRVPTSAEFQAEYATWPSQNRNGGYASVLKLPYAGNRTIFGQQNLVGFDAGYWTSTYNPGVNPFRVYLFSEIQLSAVSTSLGYSVRCIKHEE